MYKIRVTTSFKKDAKLAKKRRLDLEKLKTIILLLEQGKPLSKKNKDHSLIGNWGGCRECHIEPDWLLIYRYEENFVELVRTGSHSDLFRK